MVHILVRSDRRDLEERVGLAVALRRGRLDLEDFCRSMYERTSGSSGGSSSGARPLRRRAA